MTKFEKPKVVESKEELLANARTMDSYLQGNDSYQQDYAKDLIRRGNSFVIAKETGKLKFYPSRFIGYKDITLEHHEWARKLDLLNGRKTNKAIDAILGERSSEQDNEELCRSFGAYCDSLGIVADKKEHKFWLQVLENQ